jgi:hypothetical protein
MDYLREFEELQKGKTIKQLQQIERMSAKPVEHTYPYKNTCKKGTGEYFATREDKINLVKYLVNHPTVPKEDKEILSEKLQ